MPNLSGKREDLPPPPQKHSMRHDFESVLDRVRALWKSFVFWEESPQKVKVEEKSL